nr:beta-1,3-galactosyltransferase GALT1 [Tanacetum cinerariifolium]
MVGLMFHLGDFWSGEPLLREPDPSVILHYNVRLHEERCPKPEDDKNKKESPYNFIYYAFLQGYLLVATLRVGSEGVQMTVDGKHITSFAFRETLEAWLLSEVRISGDIKVVSVVASGLPTFEDSDHIIDLESLKSPSISPKKKINVFIGVFSTANNFKLKMAHNNQVVNEELWTEAKTYGDIQLMPFVDYSSLISWKTIVVCIFGTEVISAKYLMMTDDDAFVRVDEVLVSLNRVNVSHGLLYGLINPNSQPHKNPNSKLYISPQEWPEERYPS